jgi:hypothetical protein
LIQQVIATAGRQIQYCFLGVRDAPASINQNASKSRKYSGCIKKNATPGNFLYYIITESDKLARVVSMIAMHLGFHLAQKVLQSCPV